jgi:hypothetical protein
VRISGEKTAGLSARTIVRIKTGWEEKYKAWCQPELSMQSADLKGSITWPKGFFDLFPAGKSISIELRMIPADETEMHAVTVQFKPILAVGRRGPVVVLTATAQADTRLRVSECPWLASSATLGRTSGVLLFVCLQPGQPLDEGDIHRTFYALSRQIGLRGRSDSRGPRLHDIRHCFATNTLVQWYRSGQDPERRLPLLSAYLGHVHVADTQWYLEGSPELMREAVQWLQQRWEDRP